MALARPVEVDLFYGWGGGWEVSDMSRVEAIVKPEEKTGALAAACHIHGERDVRIRILIIDEHKAARESLARRLKSIPELDVVGTTGDGEEGLRQIESLHPDVVLLDIRMKKTEGMDVCRRACRLDWGTRVVVLTSYSDLEEQRMASQAGARGYLLKDIDTPKLAQWIRDLAASGEAAARSVTGGGSASGQREVEE
jgi:DNA-binding NarL/FixJ family response regulator